MQEEDASAGSTATPEVDEPERPDPINRVTTRVYVRPNLEALEEDV